MELTNVNGIPRIKKMSRKGKRGSRPIMYGGQVYCSAEELSREFGMGPSRVYKVCLDGANYRGKPIRYATLKEAADLVENSPPPFRPLAIPVWIDGKAYSSKNHAIKALKMGGSPLEKMLMDGRATRATPEELKEELKEEEPKRVSRTPVNLSPVPVGLPFQGVVWGDGGVTVRIPGTPFSMTRKRLADLPEEIAKFCVWK